MRIAVIGSGISGLGAALRLTRLAHAVTLFEANPTLGGHTNTVDIAVAGKDFAVDTGFLVYNERTYPNLIRLFSELQIPTVPSDMSFAVSVGPHQREWCGSNLRALVAQPGNLLRPRFWTMLRDIVRFNREATALALGNQHSQATLREPLAAFLERNGYSAGFRDDYLLPMAAAIWSCPMHMMRSFPLGTFVRFFHNHGLLQIEDRPQWFTVAGGARQYVERIAAGLASVRVATPVLSVRRECGPLHRQVGVTTRAGEELFDAVVLASHSDQSLRMLADASPQERSILGAIRYQPNRAILHTDVRLMPARRRAWAAWNYLSNGDTESPEVSVTYWLNRLQPLPVEQPVLLSLNPLTEPSGHSVLDTFRYEHPVFDMAAVEAQSRLETIQGERNTWFAGAWTGFGFHEDGLRSGLAVAEKVGFAERPMRAAAF